MTRDGDFPFLRNMLSRRSLSFSVAYLRMKKPTFDGPLPPKKPRTAFNVFFQLKGPKLNEEFGAKGNSPSACKKRFNLLHAAWNSLSPNERKKYEIIAAKDKDRYERALSEYTSWQDAHGTDEYKSYISRRKQFLKKVALKRGKLLPPPKLSGYHVFLVRRMKNQTADRAKPVTKWLEDSIRKVAKEWNELSKKEKAEYDLIALHAYQQRTTEFERRLKAQGTVNV